MSEKEGVLRLQSSGRWAVCRPGREPIEITSGEQFRVEIDGELRVTRMEQQWSEGYYSTACAKGYARRSAPARNATMAKAVKNPVERREDVAAVLGHEGGAAARVAGAPAGLR